MARRLASVFLALALYLLPFALLSPSARAALPVQSLVVLTPGTIIDHSVRVQPDTYRLPSASLDAPALPSKAARG